MERSKPLESDACLHRLWYILRQGPKRHFQAHLDNAQNSLHSYALPSPSSSDHKPTSISTSGSDALTVPNVTCRQRLRSQLIRCRPRRDRGTHG
ncbi:hypothetical protein OF83DRAFT_213720 [Amylostereum chailletii]|nr:hypothetical protein OF83DRAFT_213720 [Amylostereum chailletii]